MHKILSCLFAVAFCGSVFAQSGAFWGTTYGNYGDGGRIYRFLANGTQPVGVKIFTQSDKDGAYPLRNAPLLASDGKLYGTAQNGGRFKTGVLYSLDPVTFQYTKVHDFNLPIDDLDAGPFGKLVEGSDGFLYGCAYFGTKGIFKIKKDGTQFTKLEAPSSAWKLGAGLIKATDGNLYSVAEGFNNAPPFVFRLSTAGVYTKVLDLPAGTSAGLIAQASNGRLYGVAMSSGSQTLFSVQLDGNNVDQDVIAGHYITNAVEGPGPFMYGVAIPMNSNEKILFRINMNGSGFTKLYEFEPGYSPGEFIVDGNTMYGITSEYDDLDKQVIFKVGLDGTGFQVLGQFGTEAGSGPTGISMAPNQVLLAVARRDAKNNTGSILKVKTDGTGFAKVKDFHADNDGNIPGMHLIQLPEGDMLGTAALGGLNNGGVIFTIGEGDTYNVVYNFDGKTNGAIPIDVPVPGPEGFYYGTTIGGGANDTGIIYKIKKDGSQFQKIFDFGTTNGTSPYSGLTLADGRLYGMTFEGGANNQGVVFGIDPDGTDFQKLIDFNGANGSKPMFSKLVYGTDGFLYGCSGGSGNGDVFFKIKPNGSDYISLLNSQNTIYHGFYTDPLLLSNGDILVVATRGGAKDRGAILNVAANGSSSSVVHEFDVTLPYANIVVNGHLTLGPDGLIYGVEPNGGSAGTGTVFKMNPTGSNYTRIEMNFNDNPLGTATPWYGLTYTADKQRQSIVVDQEITVSVSQGVLTPGTATSGLPLTYVSSDPLTALVSGSGLTLLKPGDVTITLRQAGNVGYFAAKDVTMVVHITPAPPQPGQPKIWGLSTQGGNGFGAVFSSDINGTNVQHLHDFSGQVKGANTEAGGIIKGNDGMLYGVSSFGGPNNTGVIFKIHPLEDRYEVLFSFGQVGVNNTGSNPRSNLLHASNGALYGMASAGGANTEGTIFKINTDGTGFTRLFDLNSTATGMYAPYNSPLIEHPDGNLYGVMRQGGAHGAGTVFKISLAGAFEKIFDFNNTIHGSFPEGIACTADGKLYGHLSSNTLESSGILFSLDPDGTDFTILHEFTTDIDGKLPTGPPVIFDNMIYGITYVGGVDNKGVLYKISLNGTNFEKLIDFGPASNGSYPRGYPIINADGFIHGSTSRGGTGDSGVLYRVKTDGTGFSKIGDLENGSQGANFNGPVALMPNGNVYAQTSEGASGKGSIVKFDFDRAIFQMIEDLFDHNDGQVPIEIIQIPNGDILGVTYQGGQANRGVIFKMKPDGTGFKVVHNFTEIENKTNPRPSLVYGRDGYLYGAVADIAGLHTSLYKIKPDGTGYTVVRAFTDPTKGRHVTYVFYGADDVLYGTTAFGGTHDAGVIFKVNRDGSGYEVLRHNGGPSGATGLTGFVQDEDGFLYGVGSVGGAHNFGAVFRLKPDGSEYSLLHSFNDANGNMPTNNVTIGPDGVLYGTTGFGGLFGGGTAFKINRNGTGFTKLHDFRYLSPLAAAPFYSVVARGDDLYGFAAWGAQGDGGALFTLKTNGTGYNQIITMEPNNLKSGAGKVLFIPPNKAQQTIAFDEPEAVTIGGNDFTLPVTASSGLPVTYSVLDPTIVEYVGGVFKIKGVGATRITAYQAGNANYYEANPVEQMIVVNKKTQFITFEVPQKTFGDTPFEFPATSSSGLPVAYLVSGSTGVGYFTGNTFTISHAGITSITAFQLGNDEYAAATPVVKSFEVLRKPQTITFTQPTDQTLGGIPFTLLATSPSGLPVTFSTSSDKVTLSSSTVTLVKAGKVSIVASQEGDADHSNAAPVTRTFCINPLKPVITVGGTIAAPVLTSSNDTGNQWYLNATATSATDKTFIITESGTYTVKTTIDGCASVTSEPANVVVTGLEDELDGIDVYPNPASDEVIVRVDHGTSIQLIDLLGRTLESRISKNQEERFDVRNFAKGVFLFRIDNDNRTVIRKFVKQ